jgi:branched-chain amino acid transport system permease protein
VLPEPRRVDGWIGFGVLLAAGVSLPLLTRDSYHLDVATVILRNLLLTMSLRYVMSTGQLNMAHVSFMGIAAYASALLVTRAGWSFWAALALAPLLAALAAIPIGRVALRVSGPYYFLISFAFLEVLRLVFNNFFVD